VELRTSLIDRNIEWGKKVHEYDGISVNQCMILQGCVDDVKSKWEFHITTVSHLRQATVLIVVPPIAVDITQLAEAGDRTAFASVHTIISGAAPLSPDFLRKLKRLTGIRRVQTCEPPSCRFVVTFMVVRYSAQSLSRAVT